MGKHRTFGLTGSLAVLTLFGFLWVAPVALAQAAEPPSFGPIPAVPPTHRGSEAGEPLDLPAVDPDPPAARGNSMLRGLFQRPARPSAPKPKPRTHDLRVTRAGMDTPPAPTEPAAEVAAAVRAVGKVEGVAAPGLRVKLKEDHPKFDHFVFFDIHPRRLGVQDDALAEGPLRGGGLKDFMRDEASEDFEVWMSV